MFNYSRILEAMTPSRVAGKHDIDPADTHSYSKILFGSRIYWALPLPRIWDSSSSGRALGVHEPCHRVSPCPMGSAHPSLCAAMVRYVTQGADVG
jgi:hypothetical protein